ncbi:PadR family transcriptional regulator [Microbacterium halophytorum]|uniref:PadR family transcriptional regulator n=1 Tax=Microbacterium halophytorum TaxID=2067568 RepID=UPI000CFD8B35|nr:PadR family transcriptional regulator [Microbacterium halophytorum]
MILARIILGFLAVQPMTGYDLTRAFASSATYFWSADKAQIYRTLVKLVADGYARIETVPGTDAPDRVVHHLTAAGREALDAWLASDPDRQPERDAFLARIFFAGDLDGADLIRVICARRADAISVRDELRGVRVRTPHPDPRADRASWLRSMTLEQGIRDHEAHIDWLDELLAGILEGEKR